MQPAGYSKKSLIDKLGIKPDSQTVFLNTPEYILDYFKKEIPNLDTSLNIDYNYIHFFTTSYNELQKEFPNLKKHLNINGLLWISWPKGTSNIETDLNESKVQQIGLQNGLVDVKVAAVDETWSALKFVYRIKDRKLAKK